MIKDAATSCAKYILHSIAMATQDAAACLVEGNHFLSK